MAPVATFAEYTWCPARRESTSSQKSNGKAYSASLMHTALSRHIKSINPNTCEPGEEDAFFVADLGEVYRQHLRWKRNLPRVTPHYAVKCNPDPKVVGLLANLGAGFDCASKAEMELVLDLGVHPSRIIYAQPCKTKSYIRWAADQGVKQMTFDNADELHKIHDLFPSADLYLRILTDDSSSLCRLSQKFGASLNSTSALLELARSLGLNVVGVSFHVGSGASDPTAFLQAIRDAHIVFSQARDLGYYLHTLDIGGGFSSDTFDAMSNVVSEAIDGYFPPSVRVIAEPGRYYVANAFTLACNVIARRDVVDAVTHEPSYMLYLNDGVYGNFSNIIFDHQQPVPHLLPSDESIAAADSRRTSFSAASKIRKQSIAHQVRRESITSHARRQSAASDARRQSVVDVVRRPSAAHRHATVYSLWGPTCDGIDLITARCSFPLLEAPLEVGDWLIFDDMGAYTRCSATRFNGFSDGHEVIYCNSERGAASLLV
ncbi:hypothetical protein MMC13_001731 [Lambiella insularis]|nr:hypothetical protein [Lambiella insularis]